jgi:hypothetical protein
MFRSWVRSLAIAAACSGVALAVAPAAGASTTLSITKATAWTDGLHVSVTYSCDATSGIKSLKVTAIVGALVGHGTTLPRCDGRMRSTTVLDGGVTQGSFRPGQLVDLVGSLLDINRHVVGGAIVVKTLVAQ